MEKYQQTGQLRRLLYYFPIIHTPSDMGGLAETIRALSVQRGGQEEWLRKQDLVLQMWRGMEEALESLRLPYSKVRIYQDGLPICGKELDIIRDLAKQGSPNHRLLLKLIKQGACLMGTESADLLLREYELIREGVENNKQSSQYLPAEQAARSLTRNLHERDEFIAKRINDTLANEEVGIVFLGMLHDLSPWLADDLEIVYPFYSPQSLDDHDHVA